MIVMTRAVEERQSTCRMNAPWRCRVMDWGPADKEATVRGEIIKGMAMEGVPIRARDQLAMIAGTAKCRAAAIRVQVLLTIHGALTRAMIRIQTLRIIIPTLPLGRNAMRMAIAPCRHRTRGQMLWIKLSRSIPLQ